MTTDAAAEEPVELGPRVVGEHALTRTQSQIWTAQRLHPDVPLANMGKRHRIVGELDHRRLADAFELVVRGSDMLRSVVSDGRGPVSLRTLAHPPAPTEIIELPADQLDAWCDRRIARPIDATVCAYDSVVLVHGPTHSTWWLDLHHLVTDAWSSSVVFEATQAAYERLGDAGAATSVDDLDLQPFVAHVDSVAARSTDEQRATRRDRWSDDAARFGDPSPITPYGPRTGRTTEVERLAVPVGEEWATDLRSALDGPYRTLSSELGLLGLLVTSTAVAIHRLDGRDSVSVGVPLHHRSGPRAQRVIGPLMELYPLRVTIEPGDTFAALFQRVQRSIIELLRRARPGESPEPDFEVVVNVLTARYGTFAGLETTTDWVRSSHVEPSHVIRVQAYDYDGALNIELDLNAGLSTDGAHRAMPHHLAAVVAAAVDDPEQAIGSFDLVTDDEHAALDHLNPPAAHTIIDEPVHVCIQRRLEARPDAVVAEHDGTTLVAGDLDSAADSTAKWLVSNGVTPGDRVGIRMPRGLDVLVAVHGVLRAGAAFVMLDPTDPPARHEAISIDAGLRTILDQLPTAVDGEPPLPVAPGLDDLAYVLYTSGSTGTPKGVPISHRGLADYLSFAVEAYTGDDVDVVMPLHSRLVFDLTITSLFLPLLVGGRIVVVAEEGVEGLARLAADTSMSVLKATPSQLDLLVRMTDRELPLHTVIVGGEAFRRPVAQAFAGLCRPGVRIFNEYGPTEAVVGCMIHEWQPEIDVSADVPIGHACPGADVFVLDSYGRRSPPGSWGELFVRRPGMAVGYLNRPELSSERFVPVDGVEGGPLYRTGDRARVERDGVLVYGGRLDDQLKIGGIRLEPGEIEAALVAHPAIGNAVVRMWQRSGAPDHVRRCRDCGLGDDVPGVEFLDDGRCTTCHQYDTVAPQTASWFLGPDDLDQRRRAARRRRRGTADCLHLLSGGKDSTYALYQLVEQGWDVHALTLDNGFISPGAIENVRRTVADLGITHEFVTTDAMNDIFRDSLDRYANVCNGCYKTIYTLAIARAHELGIPVIVTGLSRGQFFETRLVPHQFEEGRFDPNAIDATVLEARRVYHHTTDAVTESLPEQRVVEQADIFEQVEFVDFYRYVDVDLADLYEFLEQRAPWVRPADTGRSTNCLINDAGIWVHRRERGFHNYAEPYAWDVRLGHKTRPEALEELDDDIDEIAVHRMLAEVGYEPKIGGVLTAWYQSVDGGEVDPDELRRHLRGILPEHSLPTAFVRIDAVPIAASAKIDVDALPAPTRVHRGGTGYEPPRSPTEERLCELWMELLDVDRVGANDDFFDLGGASLDALETVARIDETLGVDLPDAAVFRHRTVRELADQVDAVLARRSATGPSLAGSTPISDRGHSRLPPVDRRDDLPLSSGQQALLFEYRADPSTARYGVTRRFDFESPVDPLRLRSALLDVVAAQDTLRTTFSSPRVQLSPDEALAWQHAEATEPTDVDGVARRQAAEPFDVDRGPLVRATLVDGDRPVLLVSMHHLWCDAGSFDIVWKQLAVAYEGGLVSAPPVRYSDHAAWQTERLTQADRSFWTELLAPIEHATRLDLVRPDLPEPDGYLQTDVTIDPRHRTSGSIFPAFLAAVDIALAGVSDDRVVVGVPMTVRDRPDVDDVAGYFLNTVGLPLPVVGDATFADVCERTESLVASALGHRTVPFADVMRERHRSGAATDLAAIMVVHDPPPSLPAGPLAARSTTIFNGAAVTDLSLLVTETPDGCAIGAEWSGERYRGIDIGRLVDLIGGVLATGLAQPEIAAPQTIERPADHHGPALSTDQHDESVASGTVVDRIWAHADTSPESTACRQGDVSVDWATLLGRAERMAAQLVERGVERGDRVALVLSPSIGQVVAILAVLRAGAAYVPVDPTYPDERIETLLGRSGARLTVDDDDLEVMLGQPGGASGSIELPTPDDPAYVIFTSATTGPPKGVVVAHRQLAASTQARFDWYERHPGRFGWTSSFGFDSSVAGLFWTLCAGGELVLPEAGRHTDVDHLVSMIERASVTHLLMVPSLWTALLRRVAHTGAGEALSALRVVIVAGEAARPETVRAHLEQAPSATLWNEYGPTETTVWATVHGCDDPVESPIPIGGPIPGAVVRIAGADGRARPIGAAGELLIGGAGLTAGYLDDVEATNTRFVPDPDDPQLRWYRSGDRCRSRPDGAVEFLGRLDDQLNVNGVRAEPSEIISVIESYPGVTNALLDIVAVGAGTQLVAHIEIDPNQVVGKFEPDQLRRFVAERLPSTMVPVRWAVHREFARTSHGKIDRTATLAGEAAAQPSSSSSVGEMVAVWRAVLENPDLTDESDFFDAGGNSLAAVELVIALEQRFGQQVSIGAVLNARTPARLAEALGVGGSGPTAGVDRRVVLTDGEPGPVIVHVPAWDDVFGYLPLRDAVDRLTTGAVRQLALQHRAGDEQPIVHVDRLAERFVADLESAGDLDDPLVVLGWSTSGLVAYELARQLHERGALVEAVVLVDTFFPGQERQLWANRLAKYAPLLKPGAFGEAVREMRVTMRRRSRRTIARLARGVLRWADPEALADGSTTIQQVSTANPDEAFDYEPVPTDLRVVLLAASTTNPRRTIEPWSAVCSRLEIVPVEGRHRGFDSIMGVDRVDQVAVPLVESVLGRRATGQ